jgi:biopolymer transport protein ExbB/biopolymer transport protein TolQ
MDWLIRGHVALLSLMLVNTADIVCHRFYRYREARKQSCAFVRDTASALREGDFGEVTKIAERNRLGHVANVVTAGLAAFASAPPQFTDGEAIDAAERAFQRHRQKFAAELRLGLGTLTTIASTAPFIGLLGTVFGIFGASRGVAMQKDAARALVASGLAELSQLSTPDSVKCFGISRGY